MPRHPRPVDTGAITLPTLFVHNRDDQCRFCSYSGVAPLMASFTRAAPKELITVGGGAMPQGDPCLGLSRHGYIGLEDEVVGDVAAWIKAHARHPWAGP